jgi:hypothetical protein
MDPTSLAPAGRCSPPASPARSPCCYAAARIDYAQAYKNTYLMVARTGRVLVVVHSTGWETGNGDDTIARDLGIIAVRRAAVLNRNPQS